MILLFKFLKLSHGSCSFSTVTQSQVVGWCSKQEMHRRQPMKPMLAPCQAQALLHGLDANSAWLAWWLSCLTVRTRQDSALPKATWRTAKGIARKFFLPLKSLWLFLTRLTFFTFMPRPNYLLCLPTGFFEEFSLVSDAALPFINLLASFWNLGIHLGRRIQETVLVHPLVYPYNGLI